MSEEKSPDKCQKCGIEEYHWQDSRGAMWMCGTWSSKADDDIRQSDPCRIRELEASHAALVRVKEAAEAFKNESRVCGPIFQAKLDELEAALAAAEGGGE